MNQYNEIPRELRDMVWVPTDASAIDGYDFQLISEFEHSRGVAWSARIVKSGTIVCIVENAGHGACNNYVVVNDEAYAQFVDDAKRCYTNTSEPADLFVQFIDVYSSLQVAS